MGEQLMREVNWGWSTKPQVRGHEVEYKVELMCSEPVVKMRPPARPQEPLLRYELNELTYSTRGGL